MTLVKVKPEAPDPAEIQMLGKPDKDPAEIVLLVEELSVVFMVAVFEVKVKFVVVAVVHTVPVEASVQVPEPIVRVRVLVLLVSNDPMEKFLLLASNVPLVRVTNRLDPTVRLSAS